MINSLDRFDYTILWVSGNNTFGLFRVGAGANGFNANLGALSELLYDHYYDGNRCGRTAAYSQAPNLTIWT